MFLSVKRSHVLVVWALCSVLLILISWGNQSSRWPVNGPLISARPAKDASESIWRQLTLLHPQIKLQELPVGSQNGSPSVQRPATPLTWARSRTLKSRRNAVRRATLSAWDDLHRREPSAETMPTIVGCLDTLWVLGLKKQFWITVDLVCSIDFGEPPPGNQTSMNISQMTIQILGALLSAYDLSGDRRLLVKALEVGEMLLKAYDTSSGLPHPHWSPSIALQGIDQPIEEIVRIEDVASMTLEFTRLSQVSGDMRWFSAAQHVLEIFADKQSQTELPGLWPRMINAKEKTFNGMTTFSIGSSTRSFFESLLKQSALTNNQIPSVKTMYETSMAVAIDRLIYRPMFDGQDARFAGTLQLRNSQTRLETVVHHSDCSLAALFALGGELFSAPGHVQIGQKIMEGCMSAYLSYPYGIMPESFSTLACVRMDNCPWDETLYRSAVAQMAYINGHEDQTVPQYVEKERLPPGFTDISDRHHRLRSEAIEALFVLHRVTGDEDYQERAWQMWTTVNEATRVGTTNAILDDVTATTNLHHANVTERYWLSATLKYFYLTFSEPAILNLDEWVFSTEGHPFKVG